MNKNIYIIGGAGLIGSSLLEKFVENKSTRLIVLDIHRPKIIHQNIFYVKINCTKINQFNKKIKNIFQKFGNPDVLINCSYPVTKKWYQSSFLDINYENFKKNIELHLNSYCWTAKVFADVMKKNRIYGKIILFSSIYGIVAQNNSNYEKTNLKMNMTYPVIKSGIIGFTKQAASFYGKFNININVICPGGILGHIKGKSKKQDKNFLTNISKNIPLKRLAKVDEVANVAIFLSSKKSNYITGQAIVVDGGYTII